MQFTRGDDVVACKSYRDYREFVYRDFRGFCAYCFRHETEFGGKEHVDLDHFVPKWKSPELEHVYSNIYCSCKACNQPPNKGKNWPSDAELAEGKEFCDPCRCNPFDLHYSRNPDFKLVPLTPSGEYTVRILRLNERKDVYEVFRRRLERRAERSRLRDLLSYVIGRLESRATKSQELVVLASAKRYLAAVSAELQSEPFVASPGRMTIPDEEWNQFLSVMSDLSGQ